jgi:hypothetical protein
MYSGSPKTEAKGSRSAFFDENFPDKRTKNIDNEFTGSIDKKTKGFDVHESELFGAGRAPLHSNT